MAYRHLEPFSKQLTIVIGLTVVGLMAFGLALSYYRNVLFDQTLLGIAKDNDGIRDEILAGRRELEYYRSAQYKDKYAKENLGKVNIGEKVLVLLEDPEPATTEDTSAVLNEQQEAAYMEMLKQMPIGEHWNMFLLHREKLEELRQSFGQ